MAPALTKPQRDLWRKLEPDGWEQRGFNGSGALVLIHPRANGHVALHCTPGDVRHDQNTLATARRLLREADQAPWQFVEWARARHGVPDDGRRRVHFFLRDEIAAYLEDHPGTPKSLGVGLTKVRPWFHLIKRGGRSIPAEYEIAGAHADLPVTLAAPPPDEPSLDVALAKARGKGPRPAGRALRPGRVNGNGNGAAEAPVVANGNGHHAVIEDEPPADRHAGARLAWDSVASQLAAALHPDLTAERDLAVAALRRAEAALTTGLSEVQSALDLLGETPDG